MPYRKIIILISFVWLFLIGNRLHAQEGMAADSLMRELSTAVHDTSLLRLNLLIADDLIFVDPDTTGFFLERAITLAEQLRDTSSLARILNLKGILHSIRGRELSGLECYQQSLKYYEAIGDQLGASKCINNIGTIYSELGYDSLAVQNFKESFAITSKLGQSKNAANNLFNISGSYITLKQIDSAQVYAEKLIAYQKEHGDLLVDPSSLLANIYLEKNQLDSALYYNQKFVDFLIKQNDEYFLLSATNKLALIHRKMGNYQQALQIIHEAEAKAIELDFQDQLLGLYEEKAQIYSGLKNFDKAFEYQLKFQELKDELDSMNNASQINELNARYESAKREKEIIKKDLIISEQAASRKAITRISFLIVVSILLITGIVGYFLIKGRRTNKVLNAQNKEIDKQRQDIISSINYAKKIQNSILVPESRLKEHFPDSFIYFQPRDIVSGDFYWFSEENEEIMLSTIDCTGHGVPGAFMSLIANSNLNKVVNEMKIHEPSEILNEIHRLIIRALKQNEGKHNAQDGMDMSFCTIDKKSRKIRFAGAQNGIYLVQGDSLEEIKADSLSIGGTAFASKMNGHNFTTREISYESGAYLFMCTDGLLDQFGGTDGKKFNKARFRKLLIEITEKGITHAKNHIQYTYDDWTEGRPQLDDILIIGAKL